MRLHAAHQLIAPWSTGTPVLDPARLVAVRIEPAFRRRRAVLVLDFVLADEGGCTVIPSAFADPNAVIERGRDPIVFPRGMPGGDAFALALAERALQHLEGLVLGGDRIVEHVHALAPAPRFDAARAAGCFGAAPLRDSLLRLAPYLYARRFVRGRTVRIDAPDALGGWALLRDAGSVGVAASRADAAERAWYGDAPAAARADVAILGERADAGDAACVVRLDASAAMRPDGTTVGVADPTPLDVMVSFDPADGPVRRWFAIERAPEPAARDAAVPAYIPAGGSGGRIAVVLGREDGLRRPGADADEARALVAALAAEGFDAALAEPGDLDRADLVHVIGTRDGARARAVVDRARRAAIPVALHAHDEDAARGGWWGAEVARYCFEYGDDEREVNAYLAMLARRAVAVGDARADAPYAPAVARAADADAALRDADVVFVATEEEGAAVRARTARAGAVVVVGPLAAHAAPERIGALTGSDPFALIHAPIGALGNQLLVARCAAEAAIPLVIVGPVADASYLERVREFGGPGLVLLPGEPAPGVAAAMRAAAAVVLDAAWIGEGGSRLAASALAGARLAIADRRRFAPEGVSVRRFDPADAAAITRALGEAWDEALRAPGRLDAAAARALAPAQIVRTIVQGYSAALPASGV